MLLKLWNILESPRLTHKIISSMTITDLEASNDYLAAQRAAVEAVEVGRATLQAAGRQGEQLRNADRLADETNYLLERSTRLLKNMTWIGWVQNMLTTETATPIVEKPVDMADVPPFAKRAAQSIQNYQANLTVLESCETQEQRETCLIICNSMYDSAEKELQALKADENNPKVVEHLSNELTKLYQLQKAVLYQHYNLHKKPREEANSAYGNLAHQTKAQDEHLEIIADNLEELKTMATSLNEEFTFQNKLMSTIEEKGDTLNDKTRSVIRRADRLKQKKSWVPPKKVFEKWISIQHIKSGRYLSVESNGNPTLLEAFHPEKSAFGVWMRDNRIFGLKNKYINRFLGQNLFGTLVCSSPTFGQREEWEADENWESSRLLISSAGWGNGGYVKVGSRNNTFQIVDNSLADFWCLNEVYQNSFKLHHSGGP
jgi:hypothetical protein